jgi:hypothetical protein
VTSFAKSERADLTFYWLGQIRPSMLMPDQRALLMRHCNDHPVAVCPRCSEALTFGRIGADVIIGKRDFCPMCRADLTPSVLKHLAECTLMRVQERETSERAALEESERLREKIREAMDKARRSGTDYLSITARRPPAHAWESSQEGC